MLGQHLQDAFGQTVLIENRAGALGSIGAQEVARSAPDGYTLLMGTNTTQASNVAMLKNLPYDPVKDFAPVIRTITTAMVLLVKPDFPAKDLPQFLEYAKAHPNLTAGYGSGASQISIGQLQSRGGLSVIAASYRGVPQAITDVMAGAIDLTFARFLAGDPADAGRHAARHRRDLAKAKRADAGASGARRGDAGLRSHDLVWSAGARQHAGRHRQQDLCRKRKIPVDAGDQGEARKCRRDRCPPMPPAEFGAFIQSEIVRWSRDVKAAGIEASIADAAA